MSAKGKFLRLTATAIALVAALSLLPVFQKSIAHASAAPDRIVLTAVDATAASCQTHETIQGVTTSAPCLPGTVMKTTQVLLSQALANHWSYLEMSSVTAESIETLIETQRQVLRARLGPASTAAMRKAIGPNYTCGWTVDRYMSATLNGDLVDVHVNYYLASDCNTIVLSYSTSYLDSPYYNPMYWQRTYYNQGSYPYCWTHSCFWGNYGRTIAPPYTYERQNYNATEEAGHGFSHIYTDCQDYDHCSYYYNVYLGNL